MTSFTAIIAILASGCLAAAFLMAAEAAIWACVCLILSTEETIIELTMEASYRLWWRPKIVTAVVALPVITLAARHYQHGGKGLLPIMLCAAPLLVFAALVGWESVRAVSVHESAKAVRFW